MQMSGTFAKPYLDILLKMELLEGATATVRGDQLDAPTECAIRADQLIIGFDIDETGIYLGAPLPECRGRRIRFQDLHRGT
jgi:hypothetical protein